MASAILDGINKTEEWDVLVTGFGVRFSTTATPHSSTNNFLHSHSSIIKSILPS